MAVYQDPTKKKVAPPQPTPQPTIVGGKTTVTGIAPPPMKGIMDTGIAKTIANPVQAPGTVGGVVTTPSPQESALAKYGGQDAYIKSQLERFKTGNATLQGKINTDLSRFGVNASPITGRPDQAGFNAKSLQGATIGSENGGSFFQLPDGSREWIDTPEEQQIADEINRQNSELGILQAGQEAQRAQGRADLDYSLQDLNEQQALDSQRNIEAQNRFGGLYSGGLQYQQGNLQRTYGRERGRLQNNYDIANRQLESQYGSQVNAIKNNINNLLSAAPGQINAAIAQAAAAKEQARRDRMNENVKAAEDFYKTYGYAVNPQEDYSGFWRQVASGKAKPGQKEQMEIDKFTADQQKEIFDSLWKAADQTGVISQALADLYPGILKAGEQTRAAREFAAQQGLRQDASDLAWIKEFNNGSESDSGTAKAPSASEATTYLKNLITSDVTVKGKLGAADTTKKVKETDIEKLALAFEDSYDTLFSGTDADARLVKQMLVNAGYTHAEIEEMKKRYPSAFNNASVSSGGGGSKVNVPQAYQGVINDAQKKYGLSGSNILAKIANAESSFNPKARNKGSGAAGMFQFMPATARGYGIDPYDVNQAADAAGKMISGLLAKYDGDYSKALAGYNWGGGNVDDAIQRYGNKWIDHAPKETRAYIKKILG